MLTWHIGATYTVPNTTVASDTHAMDEQNIPPWAILLKAARERLGLSRPKLAGLAALPRDTLRRWEDGSRHPSETRLRRLLDALDCPTAEANGILEAAGYRPEPTLFPNWRFPRYFYTLEELQNAVEDVPWPQYVINDNVEVVAANTAVQALWGIDFAQEQRQRSAAQMNLLSVANDYRFTEHVANWDECVAVLAGVFKGRPDDSRNLDQPDAYFNSVLEEFAKGDPAYLSRLIEIFTTTPAREPKVRWMFPVIWRDDVGEMRFMNVISTASEPDGLSFNDWHPLDAETWTVLEQVKAHYRNVHG